MWPAGASWPLPRAEGYVADPVGVFGRGSASAA